jgi:hypothetical protein
MYIIDRRVLRYNKYGHEILKTSFLYSGFHEIITKLRLEMNSTDIGRYIFFYHIKKSWHYVMCKIRLKRT